MTRFRLWTVSVLAFSLAGCSREVKTTADPVTDTAPVQLAAADFSRSPPLPTVANLAVVEVPRTELAATSSIRTTLYSEHDAEVGARTDGMVKTFVVDLGDHVGAGQLLAVLDDAEERAVAESAAAALELAHSEHTRAMRLQEQNVISRAELDRSAYQVRAAQAAVQEANVHLERTRIRAPFAGAISRRFIRVGQSIAEGEPLFRVTALSPLHAQFRVPELEARSLGPGQTLRLRSAGGEQVRGTIARIAPAIDPASGTVEVLANVPEPDGLRPGSAVTVEIEPRTAAWP